MIIHLFGHSLNRIEESGDGVRNDLPLRPIACGRVIFYFGAVATNPSDYSSFTRLTS